MTRFDSETIVIAAVVAAVVLAVRLGKFMQSCFLQKSFVFGQLNFP